MLLIPIGRAGRLLTFDVIEPEHCDTCGERRDFYLRLRYEWGSLFYLPVCVTERDYQLVCPECEHGWRLKPASGNALVGHDPIPWRHRNGWMILASIALVVGVAIARSRGLI